MEPIKIKNVTKDTIGDVISLCIPPDIRDNTRIIEGMRTKEKWAQTVLDVYGSFAKIAYRGSTPVGMIQYKPNIDERIIEITCIFVPDSQNHEKGIGTALLTHLLTDMKTPKSYFNNNPPRALVTYAFEIPGQFPQNAFYQKRGFKNVEGDPYLMYYPLQKGFVYTKKEFTPQEEDRGRVLIFYDPSCPFCVSFYEKLVTSLREITDIPIELINTYEDSEEVKKRGIPPYCVVNKIPIQSFVTEKEKFQAEVMSALTKL